MTNENIYASNTVNPDTATEQSSLYQMIDEKLANYFSNLGDAPASNVYEMVLSEVEVPMLKRVLKHTRGNQSKAAIVLGLSRGTLRKKLKLYGMEKRIKSTIASL